MKSQGFYEDIDGLKCLGTPGLNSSQLSKLFIDDIYSSSNEENPYADKLVKDMKKVVINCK